MYPALSRSAATNLFPSECKPPDGSGPYEHINSETLVFSGHAEGKREAQNWKIKEKAIEVLVVSVLVR
jgi:hypothetical protein